MERIQRTDEELIQALEDHLGILRNAIDNARQGDLKFVKAIAGTLRVLVHSGGRNTPLLITLAGKYSINPTVITNEPRGVVERSLEDFLKEIAFASGTENILLSKADLIAKLSQQEGGAHEDLGIERDLHLSKGNGFLIGSMPPLARSFIGLGECIYNSGIRTLIAIRQS